MVQTNIKPAIVASFPVNSNVLFNSFWCADSDEIEGHFPLEGYEGIWRSFFFSHNRGSGCESAVSADDAPLFAHCLLGLTSFALVSSDGGCYKSHALPR